MIARANRLCPGSASETWGAELALLAELGAIEDARALAATIVQTKDAPAAAKQAGAAASVDLARPSQEPGGAAWEAAKKAYAEAATAFLRKDHETADRAARRAWASYHPNPDALTLAGLAARARGDTASAQRLFDRARSEAVPRGKDNPCSFDHACAGRVRLLDADPEGGDDDILASSSALIAVNMLQSGTRIVDAGGRTRALLDHAPGGMPFSSFAYMAFSPDGRHLMRVPRGQGKQHSAAETYDAKTGLLVRQMPAVGAGYGMGVACLSPDGKRLAGAVVGKGERSWEIWALDVESGRKVWSAKIGSPPTWIGYTGDGKYIASIHFGDGPRGVELHDAKTGQRKPLGKEVVPSSFLLATSPDGAHLAGFFEERLRLVDVRTGKLGVTTEVTQDRGDPRALSFSPDGKHLMVARFKGVTVVDTASGKLVASLAATEPPGFVASAAFLDARHILLTASDSFWEWEIGAAKPRLLFGPSIARQTRAAFSPVSALIASGFADGDVALWDPESPAMVRRLSGHTGAISALAFSHDGTALVSASRDGSLRKWEVPSGRALGVLAGHTGPVLSLAVSPDDKLVASSSDDTTVRLWDLATGVEVRKLPHPTSARTMAFSNDGKHLLTGAQDGVLRVFDPGSGTVERAVSIGKPVQMAFWTDGSEIISLGATTKRDSTFFRWGIEGGAAGEIKVPLGGALEAAAHSDDGRALVLAGPSRPPIKLLAPGSGQLLEAFDFWSHGIAGVALSEDAQEIAVASAHGLSYYRKGNKEAEITLSSTPGLTAVMATTPDGYFDIVGPDSDALRRLSKCVVGSRSLPFELCEEQFRVPGLLAKVMGGDASFREP